MIFCGMCVVLPDILGYTIHAYRVFGGKASELSCDQAADKNTPSVVGSGMPKSPTEPDHPVNWKNNTRLSLGLFL